MKKYFNIATAVIASLKPKSQLPKIDAYGQSTLTDEQQQALMEWLFASLMGAGYFVDILPCLKARGFLTLH